MRLLLDTNICIYALKNKPPEVLDRFRSHPPHELGISVITELELRQGAHKSQHPEIAHGKLDRFLGPMPILPLDSAAAAEGARLRAYLERQGTPIGDLDSLIAATALAHGRILVSNNLREFSRVPGLRTDNWVSG